MGWMSEQGCEGYPVALERDSKGRWRELTVGDEGRRRNLTAVQIACECGWRSPRLPAPLGSEWFPYACFLPEEFEQRALDIWREHLRTLPGPPTLVAGDMAYGWGRASSLPSGGAGAAQLELFAQTERERAEELEGRAAAAAEAQRGERLQALKKLGMSPPLWVLPFPRNDQPEGAP